MHDVIFGKCMGDAWPTINMNANICARIAAAAKLLGYKYIIMLLVILQLVL